MLSLSLIPCSDCSIVQYDCFSFLYFFIYTFLKSCRWFLDDIITVFKMLNMISDFYYLFSFIYKLSFQYGEMLVIHGSFLWKESDAWLLCNRALASQTALFNYIGWGDAWPVMVVELALTASFKCRIMDGFHGTHSFISRQKCYREREINIDTFGQVGDHSEEFRSVWAVGAFIYSS